MCVPILLKLIGVLCVTLSGAALGLDEHGLVAHWTFDQGKGSIATDATGNGHDAKILGGAKFRKFNKGYALVLDGVDDYVDCGKAPPLNTEKAGTISVWFKPAALQGGIITRSGGGSWVEERLVIGFNTYGKSNSFIYCLADGKKETHGSLPMLRKNVWSHLAVTVEGRSIRIYRNGVPQVHASFAAKFADFPLLFGRIQGLGAPFFKGLMDDARVYNRALSADEILGAFKAEAAARGIDRSIFLKPKISARANPQSGRLTVDLDYRFMKPVPAGATLEVIALRAGEKEPLARASIAAPNTRGRSEVFLDLQAVPPGMVVITVQPRKADSKAFGKVARKSVVWPRRDPRFSPERGVKVLNNFSFELLNVKSPGAREFTIHNPRDGWVYVAFTGHSGGLAGARPRARIDENEYPMQHVADKWETMRYIPEGPHKVAVAGGFEANGLIVRAIGELFYSMYGKSRPLVPESAHYTWQWLRKHVLDNYNCIIGAESPGKYEDEIKEWTDEGKRWHTQRNLPWNARDGADAHRFWADQLGMKHPLMHGIWADEFFGGGKADKMIPIWADGIRRLKADPKLKGRQFYAFMGNRVRGGVAQIVRTVMDCDFRLAPEWYLLEREEEAHLMGYMSPSWERTSRASFEAVHPDAANNRVLILGLMSQPEESCDIYPHCNYNVFLDYQFQFIATQPSHFGLRGLQGYYSPYVGEEQTRVFAGLIRHYAIEGNTTRFFKDPYELTHIANPDFTEGTSTWTLSPATEGSIAARKAEGFGYLQGRYWKKDIGDTALWTKRNATKPNVFSQEIKALEPGRLYSLRFFTGNYQDLINEKSRSYKHTVSVKIENVEIVAEKSFQSLIKSCYAHRVKSFNRNKPYRSNYHQRVFRAKDKTARLALSDWGSENKPGGPEREELIWNFIQVQPYFPE